MRQALRYPVRSQNCSGSSSPTASYTYTLGTRQSSSTQWRVCSDRSQAIFYRGIYPFCHVWLALSSNHNPSKPLGISVLLCLRLVADTMMGNMLCLDSRIYISCNTIIQRLYV
ncbi:hypothetical protein TNCV_1617331 [Trichonephila clavipes]|nr:hypothetical protein TNCV_1617331 [Trichonephila clavipes]